MEKMSIRTTIFAVVSVMMLLSFMIRTDVGWGFASELGRRLAESYSRHKDLLPLDYSDFWGAIFVSFGLLIAASGGIGGGGVLVPLLILVYGFSPKYAIPLSNFTIVGSSITNMVLNLPKRHPNADRPLVDWDLILVMEPLTMAGAVVGAICSKILPDWLLVSSLVVLLAFTSHRTITKGISQYQKETKYFEDLKRSELSKALTQEQDNQQTAETKGLLDDDEEDDDEDDEEEGNKQELIKEKAEKTKQSAAKAAAAIDPELAALLESERSTPWDKVRLVTGMILAVIVLNLIKGGSGGSSFPSPLGIECGGMAYWGVTGLVFVLIIVVSLRMRSMLVDKWRLKRRLNFRYVEGDVEWNPRNTIVYPCICFFAGFFAGLFGVGGGIVKGPLMLEMGVNPLVASGTVAVMIMYTSVAATTMFMAFGTLTWDYAIFLFVLGLMCTAVGQLGVGYLVKKYQRVSLVSFSIGAVVALSTLLMGIQSIFSLIDAQNADSPAKNTLCGAA